MTESVNTDAFEAALASLLRRTFERFGALDSCERLSGGASQETYRVVARIDGQRRNFALRRAAGGGEPEMRDFRHPGLETEAKLMEHARAAGVPEPRVYCILTPRDGLGAGFVMEWLDGETIGARIVRDDSLAGVRERLAHDCGRILARIHGLDLDATGLRERLATLTPAEFVEQTWTVYRNLDTPQPMIDFTARWLLDNLPDAGRQTLVHNDFRNGNLMIGPDGVVAVLDWELAHIGDPVRDLGWLCTNSWRFGRSDLTVGGFGMLDDLLAGYREESGVSVDREHVHYWTVFGSFWWAAHCLFMAERYRTGPDRTVERPAIGRRTSECQIDCVNLLIPGPVELNGAVPDEDTALPRLDELIASVRDYLRTDVMAAGQGRSRFMARVAANSLDIALRDAQSGPAARREEAARLEALLGGHGDLSALRWQLVHALRDGSMALDRPDLTAHLRATVANQVAIDQPSYSGLKETLNKS